MKKSFCFKDVLCEVFCSFAAALPLSAAAATWTGAQDAFWTNAANWAEGTTRLSPTPRCPRRGVSCAAATCSRSPIRTARF